MTLDLSGGRLFKRLFSQLQLLDLLICGEGLVQGNDLFLDGLVHRLRIGSLCEFRRVGIHKRNQIDDLALLPSNHGAFGNLLDVSEILLDLLGEYVLTVLQNDHALETSRNIEISIGILIAYISRTEPAVLGKYLLVCLGIVVISDHDVVALDLNLALNISLFIVIVVASRDPCLTARNRGTYRTILTSIIGGTARKFEIEGIEFLLVDTVGFLQDLPHNLIEAFKSTLESAINCDLALIVCDATGEYDMQMQTTLKTLEEMNFNSPCLLVMNKCEGVQDRTILPYGSVAISAKENLGIDELKTAILQKFSKEYLFCKLFVPYEKLGKYSAIKSLLVERTSTFTDDGQNFDVIIPTRYVDRFIEFIVERNNI